MDNPKLQSCSYNEIYKSAAKKYQSKQLFQIPEYIYDVSSFSPHSHQYDLFVKLIHVLYLQFCVYQMYHQLLILSLIHLLSKQK